MRIRLAITLTLGDKPESADDDPAHIEDHTGYTQHTPRTDLHLGFTTPALTTEDSDE